MAEKKQELTQMGISDCALKTRLCDLGIKAVDKTVLLQLCSHIYKDMSNGYWCNPSHALLESETGYKSRRISEAVSALRDLGYIKTIATKFSNKYFINAQLIIEKHNLWRAHFSDRVIDENPFGVVSKKAIESFNKTENKAQPNKSQAGLVQNQKPVEFDILFDGELVTEIDLFRELDKPVKQSQSITKGHTVLSVGDMHVSLDTPYVEAVIVLNGRETDVTLEFSKGQTLQEVRAIVQAGYIHRGKWSEGHAPF